MVNVNVNVNVSIVETAMNLSFSSLYLGEAKGAHSRAGDFVLAGGEGGVDSGGGLEIVGGLDVVVVEGVVSGGGAVEARLEERRPVVFEKDLASVVILADPRDARVHGLSAVGDLHGRLPEQEVNESLRLE